MEDQGASQKPADEGDDVLWDARPGRELASRVVLEDLEASWATVFGRERCLLGMGEGERVLGSFRMD